MVLCTSAQVDHLARDPRNVVYRGTPAGGWGGIATVGDGTEATPAGREWVKDMTDRFAGIFGDKADPKVHTTAPPFPIDTDERGPYSCLLYTSPSPRD